MQRVYKRINGLLKVAEKKEASPNYIESMVGRCIQRNLKMVVRILKEEIVTCAECEYYVSERGECLLNTSVRVGDGDFCSWGNREKEYSRE